MRCFNPFGFTPWPVTFWISTIYVITLVVLLFVHERIPSFPSTGISKAWPGVDLNIAWSDLQTLTKNKHPFNSKANQEVRAWLLGRIETILITNNATWQLESSSPNSASPKSFQDESLLSHDRQVILFDDRLSNVTNSNITAPNYWGFSSYFEGDNIMVYIPGYLDAPGRFWDTGDTLTSPLVLVNAHYDSVATAPGATDDGIGIISLLQLLSHLTSPASQSDNSRLRHGVVLLFNNEEEDGLLGAQAFSQHPISKHTRVFLNLEGAGAGGRAALFRSTDADITRAYAGVKYPFGTVVSADGFKRKLVGSETDYAVFTNDRMNMRGLDVAFIAPRSRYHTDQDDSRDTQKKSLWHMLSASLETTKALSDGRGWNYRHYNEKKQDGVWFDVLGRLFFLINMRTMFAWNVVLLVVGPIFLIFTEVILHKTDKWYPFSISTSLKIREDDEIVRLDGLKGFFRLPLALAVASAAVIGLAFLITKVNPFILYSSPYLVWVSMLSAFVFVAWFLTRLGDAVRPSALYRLYGLLWIYIISYVLLILATVATYQLKLGSGYFLTIYNACSWLALWISYLELFNLPTKTKYAGLVVEQEIGQDIAQGDTAPVVDDDDEENDETANERTALLSLSGHLQNRGTFAHYNRRPSHDDGDEDDKLLFEYAPYPDEQLWSAALPSWTWLLQILVLLPINLILLGQLGLLITSALSQTSTDGTPLTTDPVVRIYLAMAAVAILFILPIFPFIHRFKWQLPIMLLFVCFGTAVFNLTSHPFNRDSRLKVNFVQRIDLDTGVNRVSVSGIRGWVREVVNNLPSVSRGYVAVNCTDHAPFWASRPGHEACMWQGLAPQVMLGYGQDSNDHTRHDMLAFKDWIALNITKLDSTESKFNRALADNEKVHSFLFTLSGRNTRACRLAFDQSRIVNLDFTMLNAETNTSSPEMTRTFPSDSSSAKIPNDISFFETGYYPDLRMWSRTFDPTFSVKVDIVVEKDTSVKNGKEEDRIFRGQAMCTWNDANDDGKKIPALKEAWDYLPVWVAVTKRGDALVEGGKNWALTL